MVLAKLCFVGLHPDNSFVVYEKADEGAKLFAKHRYPFNALVLLRYCVIGAVPLYFDSELTMNTATSYSKWHGILACRDNGSQKSIHTSRGCTPVREETYYLEPSGITYLGTVLFRIQAGRHFVEFSNEASVPRYMFCD